MPISTEVSLITNADLTSKTVNGTGTFDIIMSSMAAHLIKEYEAGRITGQEYTKAYIELTSAALGAAVQFLLQKDNAYWTGVKIEQDAKIVEYNLQYILPLQKALTEAQIESADKDNLIKDYTLTTTLPAQTDQILKQTLGVVKDNLIKDYQLNSMLPSQKTLVDSQNAGVIKDNSIKDYTLTQMLPAQKLLVTEQTEAQRAQTKDVRLDGTAVVGSVGKQKDLYDQQITSYKRDAEVKAAKLFTDAWITQKTIDEGLTAPNGFTNASLDTILTKLKANNQLT